MREDGFSVETQHTVDTQQSVVFQRVTMHEQVHGFRVVLNFYEDRKLRWKHKWLQLYLCRDGVTCETVPSCLAFRAFKSEAWSSQPAGLWPVV